MNNKDIKEYLKNHMKKYHNKIFPKFIDDDIFLYITNKYLDSESFRESCYRILNDIEERPVCVVCKNKVNFASISKGFYETCSYVCANLNPKTKNKIKQTKIKRYGDPNYFNISKRIETNIKKYGCAHVLQNHNIYDKLKQTNLRKYNKEYYTQTDEYKCKSKKTCLEKYNAEYYLNSEDCKIKTIKKLGVDNYRKTNECKNRVRQYHKDHKDELNEKRKQTCIKKYGCDNPSKMPHVKNKLSQLMKSLEVQQKTYNTKKQNNSFHISKKEEQTYELLKEKYPDVIRQYKDDRYPFNCDFYIPSLDLFIECNYHWTHGSKPYENSNEDKIIVESWKQKNTKFYDNAINTWTIRDPKKRKIANENNLNYLEFWDMKEFQIWLNKQL